MVFRGRIRGTERIEVSRWASKCSTAIGPWSRATDRRLGQRNRVVSADRQDLRPVFARWVTAESIESMASVMLNGFTAMSPQSATWWTANGEISRVELYGRSNFDAARTCRTEAGTRSVADATVEGNPHDADVGCGHLVDTR